MRLLAPFPHLLISDARTLAANGESFSFEIDEFRKHCLLNGLDEIGLTLAKDAAITAFEAKMRAELPWLSRGIELQQSAHA